MKTFEATYYLNGQYACSTFQAKSKAAAMRMIKGLGARHIRIDRKP